MKLKRLTTVRMTEDEGRARLERYVFGGRYGGPRVPRGVDPAVVSAFLRERLDASSSGEAFGRAGEVARFYESADVVPHLVSLLAPPRADDPESIVRAAFLIQIIADLGAPEQVALAADYFDRTLVTNPRAPAAFPLLLQTAVALAPAGNFEALRQRIAAEVDRLKRNERASEQGMMAYDKMAAILRNDVPRAATEIDAKKKLAAQPPPARRNDLVLVYLLRHPAASDYLSTWAARLLRREAMTDDADPVAQAMSQAAQTADPAKLGERPAAFQFARAVQAILYLECKPSAAQLEKYESIEGAAQSFLWDDPGT